MFAARREVVRCAVNVTVGARRGRRALPFCERPIITSGLDFSRAFRLASVDAAGAHKWCILFFGMTNEKPWKVRVFSLLVCLWAAGAQIWYYAQFRPLLGGFVRTFFHK